MERLAGALRPRLEGRGPNWPAAHQVTARLLLGEVIEQQYVFDVTGRVQADYNTVAFTTATLADPRTESLSDEQLIHEGGHDD